LSLQAKCEAAALAAEADKWQRVLQTEADTFKIKLNESAAHLAEVRLFTTETYKIN
jgi:hypothetical protein